MQESENEFDAGRKNIEERLVSESHAAGIPLEAGFIFWNRNEKSSGVPEATSVEIKFQGRTANFILSREQIEDSWERIDRSDVLVAIRKCMTTLAGRPK